MHNVKSIDKAFQLRNAYRNISGHSKNAFSYYTPTTKCGGGYTGFALSRWSVGRSVGWSVSNSCPLYNSFTNGRISFKLE